MQKSSIFRFKGSTANKSNENEARFGPKLFYC